MPLWPKRAEGVARQTLAVDPEGDLALADHVPVDDRDVILSVAVVPERDDPELAELGGELGDRDDPDAHPRVSVAPTFMVSIPVDEVGERVVGHDFLQ